MKYNSPYATAHWGTQAKDWEEGVDYHRLRAERLARAQACVKANGLGAVLCFNFDNIRYLTGTHIGEWARDKFIRYALCGAEGKPYLWDPAAPAKRVSAPWIAGQVAAGHSTMQGGLSLPWPTPRISPIFSFFRRRSSQTFTLNLASPLKNS